MFVFPRFLKTLYGSEPIRFESDLPLSQAIENVRMLLKEPRVIGRVDKAHVELARYLVKGPSRVFMGSFESLNDGSVLEGRFTTTLGSRIRISLWLFLSSFFAVLFANQLVREIQMSGGHGTLYMAIPFLVGCGVVVWTHDRFRRDSEWLAEAIRKALRRGA